MTEGKWFTALNHPNHMENRETSENPYLHKKILKKEKEVTVSGQVSDGSRKILLCGPVTQSV